MTDITMQITLDKDELRKLLELELIEDTTDKEQLTNAIHDLIYQRYELEKQ